MKRGFTLIELLVVVLIIGILAAVALPQYQKAVLRSKFAQADTLVASFRQAEEEYYMTNGEYTKDFDSLALSLPASFVTVSSRVPEKQNTRSDGKYRVVLYQDPDNPTDAAVSVQLNADNSDGTLTKVCYYAQSVHPNRCECRSAGTARETLGQICLNSGARFVWRTSSYNEYHY